LTKQGPRPPPRAHSSVCLAEGVPSRCAGRPACTSFVPKNPVVRRRRRGVGHRRNCFIKRFAQISIGRCSPRPVYEVRFAVGRDVHHPVHGIQREVAPFRQPNVLRRRACAVSSGVVVIAEHDARSLEVDLCPQNRPSRYGATRRRRALALSQQFRSRSPPNSGAWGLTTGRARCFHGSHTLTLGQAGTRNDMAGHDWGSLACPTGR